MEMKAKVTIRGAKFFRGNIEGKDHDTGRIYIDVELKGENSFGVCTQELKCEGSKLIESIKHNPFPFIAEIDMIMKTTGSANRQTGQPNFEQVVTAIKPMQRIEANAS
jgi:hypothetical protein